MANRLVWDLIVNDRGRAGLESFRRGLQGAAGDSDRFGNESLGKATAATANFTGGLMKATAAIGTGSVALVHGAAAAVAVAQSVATASGALLLIPGVVAAGGAAMATFKLGTAGVSDALKVASDDAAGYAEATKNLSREQVKFTDGVRAQSGAFTTLKKSIGNKLFAGLGDEIKPLAEQYLPVLQKQLGASAKGLNGAGRELAAWAGQSSTVAKVNKLLGNSAEVIGDAAKAAKPLANAMLNIFTASSSQLPGMTKGWGDVAKRFDTFIDRITDGGKGGQFATWIQNGTKEIGKLKTGFNQIVTEVSKPAFKDGLGKIWEGLQKSSASVSKELPGVVTAIEKLAPAFGNVIAAGGGSFGTTLKLISTAAIALAPTLNFVTAALVPLAPIIGVVGPGLFVMAKGMQALKTANEAIKVVKELSGAARGLGVAMTVGLGPVGLIIAAIALLAVGFVVAYKKSEKFRSVVQSVMRAAANIVLDMADTWLSAFGGIFRVLGKLPGKAGAAFRSAGREVQNMRSKVQGLRNDINRVKGKKVTITVHTSFYQTGKAPGTYGNGLGVLTGKAAGGPVKAYTPYLVGESGMETFMPTQDGVIIPNNRTGVGGGRSGPGGTKTGGVTAIHITVQAGAIIGSKAELRATVLDAINSAPAGSAKISARALAKS